jgi:hypothetical protein
VSCWNIYSDWYVFEFSHVVYQILTPENPHMVVVAAVQPHVCEHRTSTVVLHVDTTTHDRLAVYESRFNGLELFSPDAQIYPVDEFNIVVTVVVAAGAIVLLTQHDTCHIHAGNITSVNGKDNDIQDDVRAASQDSWVVIFCGNDVLPVLYK